MGKKEKSCNHCLDLTMEFELDLIAKSRDEAPALSHVVEQVGADWRIIRVLQLGLTDARLNVCLLASCMHRLLATTLREKEVQPVNEFPPLQKPSFFLNNSFSNSNQEPTPKVRGKNLTFRSRERAAAAMTTTTKEVLVITREREREPR
jgi:hypothetical protein